MSREVARCGSVALRQIGRNALARRVQIVTSQLTRGSLLVFWCVICSCWRGPATLKDRVVPGTKGRELMDFAENAQTLGVGLQSGAEGARLSVKPGREGVRGKAGTREAGGGEAGNGLTGMENTGVRREGSGQRAEGMRVDPTVVKQEVMDWSEMEEGMLGGQRVKQEVEDGPEVKEEKPGTLEVKEEMSSSLVVKEEKVNELEVKEKVKVKEEVMDWLEVKEEKKDNLEIKQEETFGGQNIKEEEMMDEVCIKEEKYFPKKEVMNDTKVKEEPQINPPVYLKRKLAMSR